MNAWLAKCSLKNCFNSVELFQLSKRSNQKAVRAEENTTVLLSRCLPVGAAVSSYQDDVSNKESKIEYIRLQTYFVQHWKIYMNSFLLNQFRRLSARELVKMYKGFFVMSG